MAPTKFCSLYLAPAVAQAITQLTTGIVAESLEAIPHGVSNLCKRQVGDLAILSYHKI